MKKVLTLSLAATLATSSVAFAHGGGAKFFERLDGNGDGKVTQQEMLSARLEKFDETDENHDGVVTPEERKTAREAFLAEHPEIAEKKQQREARLEKRAGERAEKRAEKREERMNRTVKRADVETRVGEHFAKLDQNGDGALTQDELKRGRGHKRGRHGGDGHRAGEGRGKARGASDTGN